MASYVPITEKEITEALKSEDTIIVIQGGQVRQLKATELVSAITFVKSLNAVGLTIGNSDISKIGDGSLTGAIAELHRLISAVPTITSGTNEPTGGEDNDIHIMFDEE